MRLALISTLGLLVGCSALFPDTAVPGTPVTVLVLKYDQTTDAYKLVRVTLKTLKNIRTLEGDAAHFLGGAQIVVDYDDLAKAPPKSEEELNARVYLDEGSPVDVALFDVGGLLHAEDFHSLSLVTTYYNFERAHLFFKDLGVPLFELPVRYFPLFEYRKNGKSLVLTDNAFWNPVVQAFSILPFKDALDLPLGMNAGVVGHEYSHAIFSLRVFPGSKGVPWLYGKALSEPDKYQPTVNLVRSVDEGLADFYGSAIVGDPAFIRKSLPDLTASRRVDPDQPRCVTQQMLNDAKTQDGDTYSPYPLGSVLAAALWETVQPTPDRLTPFARGLTDGLTDLGEKIKAADASTNLADLVNVLAFSMLSDVRPRGCGLLLDRLGLTVAQVESCSEAEPPERTCAR